MDRYEALQLLVNEQARLASELWMLPSEVWDSPSRCDGWSVARVVVHLTQGAEQYTESVSEALIPENPQAAAQLDGTTLSVEERRLFLARRAEVLAHEPRWQLLDGFMKAGEKLVEMFRNVTTADWDRPAMHMSGAITIGMFVAFRLTELGFHGWDIRAAVDPRTGVRAERCPFLLGMVRQGQVRFCRPDTELTGTCRFQIDSQVWTLRVANGSVTNESLAAVPDTTIRGDTSTYVLLATGRRSLAECVNVVVDGPHPRAERLLAATCFRL